jgi:hypothetical protein
VEVEMEESVCFLKNEEFLKKVSESVVDDLVLSGVVKDSLWASQRVQELIHARLRSFDAGTLERKSA